MENITSKKVEKISYLVKESKRARSIRLAVYPDGRVVVSKPRMVPQNIVNEFVSDRMGWIKKKLEDFSNMSKRKELKGDRDDYLKNKELARKIANERLNYFNQFYKFKWNDVSIKNTSSRYGSCSSKGNLNFNYKIALLKEDLRDYIIVHELCHLGEFNHSQKFWNLVSKTIPNYLELRRELKKGF